MKAKKTTAASFGKVILGSFLLSCLVAKNATALPSFARQTGAACEQCHTVAFGPSLTPYGRQFKLNGYTWSSSETGVPLAVMVQGGFTHTNKAQPEAPAEHFSTNDNLSVDQVSLFYGGRLSEHSGLFAQLTYSGPDQALSWDNIDLRYARTVSLGSHYAVLGASINNNPTAQDLWNTTPAWGFPYIGPALAPGPSAAPVISELGGSVLGASAYAMLDGSVYVEAGGYRGLPDHWLNTVGVGADASSHLQGVAPYVRAAYDRDNGANHWHIGALLLDVNTRPDPLQSQVDRYTDTGIDGMYQYYDGGAHSLTVNALLVHESRHLAASAASSVAESVSGNLSSSSLEVTYVYRNTFGLSGGLFSLSGNGDPLLYASGELTGSASGKPDSRGYVLQAEYIPFGKVGSIGRNWLNVRLGLQYTAYTQFNGGSTNYDGSGRNASDNDALFAYAWFLF